MVTGFDERCHSPLERERKGGRGEGEMERERGTTWLGEFSLRWTLYHAANRALPYFVSHFPF